MLRAMTLVALMMLSSAAWALEPDEVLVVYNESFAGSKALADYYVAKRAIPPDHVLGIRASAAEAIDHPAYHETIEAPIKAWMDRDGRSKKIRSIVLMRGVPLRYGPIEDAAKAQARDNAQNAVRQVESEKEKLEAERKQLEGEARAYPARAGELGRKIEALNAKLADVDRRLAPLKQASTQAQSAWEAVTFDTAHSVDSGLAVMYFADVPVQRWVVNPLSVRTWSAPGRAGMPRTFMACRLDGPSDAVVRRLIDDSIAAEAKGLDGIAYFDAQGKHAGQGQPEVWVNYDDQIRAAAAMVQKAGMKTVLDDRETVFAPNSCPRAALYCGWYSLEKYVPAFQWVRGAVGFHVASWEARTLRNIDSQDWGPQMLQAGIAATFEPTWEPFLQGFPDPSPFFAFLLTGRYTVAEAYWYTTPMASWTLTLVADPLYTPFKKNPRMTIPELKTVLGLKP